MRTRALVTRGWWLVGFASSRAVGVNQPPAPSPKSPVTSEE
jgi:hypothetical protein